MSTTYAFNAIPEFGVPSSALGEAARGRISTVSAWHVAKPVAKFAAMAALGTRSVSGPGVRR